jgi:AraC-like DNA-binding protein
MKLPSFHKTLAALPVPDDYFRGNEGWFSEPAHNILLFSRNTTEEAMDGGLHLHHRFVFCWCLETVGSITVDGHMITLEPGQGLLLFPFQQHYFSSFQNRKILWAFVSFDLTEHPFLEPLRSTVVGIDDRAEEQLRHLAGAFSRGGGEVGACLELLLGGLVEGGGLGKLKSSERGPDPRVQRVVRFVYEHLDRSLSVEDVAGVIHVSASHLRRMFRERMGISLGRFMLHARLNHARSLLHTTDLPIGRVAEACGFSSVYAFSRAYRKEQGIAPSAEGRAVGETTD